MTTSKPDILLKGITVFLINVEVIMSGRENAHTFLRKWGGN